MELHSRLSLSQRNKTKSFRLDTIHCNSRPLVFPIVFLFSFSAVPNCGNLRYVTCLVTSSVSADWVISVRKYADVE